MPGKEIADISKSVIRLSIEPAQEIRKSLKPIHNEISERADGRIRVRWNAIGACRISNIMKASGRKSRQLYTHTLLEACRPVVGLVTGQFIGITCEPYGLLITMTNCRKCWEAAMSERRYNTSSASVGLYLELGFAI